MKRIFWFQVTHRVWLGPMVGLRALGRGSDADLLLGFGLGVQLARPVDPKTMLLFPRADEGPGNQFGVGTRDRVPDRRLRTRRGPPSSR